MKLGVGQYFGIAKVSTSVDGLSLAPTEYSPDQEQPWHTHENPTLYVQLGGDHLDAGTARESVLAPLAVTYHPTSSPHHSRVGPSGAYGINLEISDAWLFDHHLEQRDLGEHRVLASTDLSCAGVALIGACAGSGITAFDLLEPFAKTEFPAERTKPRWLLLAEERLRTGFRFGVQLSSLANESGVHAVHFARVFRAHNRCSVYEYQHRLRLEDAARLVLAGVSLGEAAIEAGFTDQFHFSRLFRQHFGFAPKALKGLAKHGLHRFIHT